MNHFQLQVFCCVRNIGIDQTKYTSYYYLRHYFNTHTLYIAGGVLSHGKTPRVIIHFIWGFSMINQAINGGSAVPPL